MSVYSFRIVITCEQNSGSEFGLCVQYTISIEALASFDAKLGQDFDRFWCKIGLGGWDFYAKLGRGLVVRLVNKVEVSSSGRTLAQICFFSRYLYSFKLFVFVDVCIAKLSGSQIKS